MQIQFKRWCLDLASHDNPLAVNPKDVSSLEYYDDAYDRGVFGTFPACTVINLRNGKSYHVQGTVQEITEALNANEMFAAKKVIGDA